MTSRLSVRAIAAWIAFMTGILLGREATDVQSFAIAATAAAAMVLLGSAAASRSRSLPPRGNAERARLVGLSLLAGAAYGLANLAANWAIAESDPALRQLLVQRFARIEATHAVVVAPLLEETGFRLFLLSVLARAFLRLTTRATLAFATALVLSSVIFASLHLARPLPLDPVLADFYRIAMLLKYTPAGLLLGWIFWRWGLPYSMVCHAAANAAHRAFESLAF